MFDYSEKPTVPPVVPPKTTEDLFPTLDNMSVSSATDLTGLMYRPPMNDDELDSYADLNVGAGVIEDEDDEYESMKNWSEFD